MKRGILFFRNCLIMRIAILSLLMVFTSAGMAFAQSVVKGKITDSKGDIVIGATVMVKGTTIGTATDVNGLYSLTIPANVKGPKILSYSFLGYKTQEVTLKDQAVIDIVLQDDVANLDEVVVVGYGTQRRASVTGSVAQVGGEELLRAPVGNIANHLGGLVTGVISYQTSGQPGSDGASIIVRGAGAKYIVDGVQRDFTEIDPNEIANISVLKDASSAAIYGLDASSVIIVTTKKGKVAPSKITFTGSYGVSQNAVMLEMLDGPEYAYWYNKARQMDGNAPVFSDEHVKMMLNGDDSDGWGNTNWYKETFDLGRNYTYNVNASGGSEKLRYFASIGSYNQEGNVKGFKYNRINLRSNIDATIANNLDLTVGIAGRIEKRRQPGFSANPGDWNNIPQQAMRAHPYAPKMYHGLPVSTRTASTWVSPEAATELSGYNKNRKMVVETNLALNYNVPWVKGLKAKFMVAYDAAYNLSKAFSTPYRTMIATRPGSVNDNIQYTEAWDPRNYAIKEKSEGYALSEGTTHYEHITTNTSLNYDNQFGKHKVAFMALMETVQKKGNDMSGYVTGFNFAGMDELSQSVNKGTDKSSVAGSSYDQRNVGFAARLNYDYDNRYLAELAFRYDGSYKFGGMKKGNRWAPFPSASLGWRMSEEQWFKKALPYVDNLKLRGSVGLTGMTEGINAYMDLSTLKPLDAPAAVIGGQAVSGLMTNVVPNFNLTWAKGLQYNGGIELSMWGGKLGLEVDVFYKYLYDMLSKVTGGFPDSWGGYHQTYENKNKQEHKGFEFVLSHSNRIGDFAYKVALNGTYTKRIWLRYTDDINTSDYLKLTGKEVGSQIGFIALGLYQNQEQIDNSAMLPGNEGKLRPGDIIYMDRNGDGKITYDQDRGYVGKNAYPKFVGGFTFNGSWRGIDLSFMFQGALGRDVALTGVYEGVGMDNSSMTLSFYHDANSPRYLVENAWTEDNRGAKLPRLTIDSPTTHNAYSSTFWYKNGDYLRLKNMQIGYTFPQKWMNAVGISNLRVYVEGENLFTISELQKYNIDPEQPNVSNGYYPQQRIFSVGVNLSF